MSLLLVALLALSGLVVVSGSAQAVDTGGYPDADAVDCPPGYGEYAWCKNGSVNSERGYGYKNCTDFVAWKLDSLGVSSSKWQNRGDGGQWNDSGTGVTINNTPAYGAAAVNESAAPPYGHVSFVESVNSNGTITISEYNYGSEYNGWTSGRYGLRTGTPAQLDITNFVHFGVSGSAGSGVRSDFNGDSKADVVWYESWNNGGVKVISDKPGAPSGPWTTGYAAPTWASIGDFNGDGHSDMVWYESAGGGTIKVMITSPSGAGFASANVWTTGYTSPGWAGVGDFTGDGKADIAWYDANVGGGTIKLLITNSAGNGFASANAWATGYGQPSWAGVGNFTLDGKADIAWYESWNNGGTIKVLATNSAGNGFASANAWVSGFGMPKWAGVGNFTLDGRSDIVWYEQVNGGSIKVIATDPSGNGFASANTWTTGYGKPTWAAVANISGGTYDDVAWYESWNNGGTIKLLATNAGGSSFASANAWRSGYSAPTWAGPGYLVP